jgi:hypothetical protein
MSDNTDGQSEIKAVEQAPVDETPAKKTRGRKKKEVEAPPAVEQEAPLPMPEPEPLPVVVDEPKPKAKRKPREVKKSEIVVEVVPLQTYEAPEDPVTEMKIDQEEDKVKIWQEVQQGARVLRKQMKTERYKRLLEGKL